MGIHTAWVKTCVFALGGGIAGVVGCSGPLRAGAEPDDMGFFFSVNYLIFWVFGAPILVGTALSGPVSHHLARMSAFLVV